MPLSKKQKADRAQKKIDEARALLAAAEAEGAEAGIEVSAPAIQHETKKFTNTVWVGCKLPNGLIIQCGEWSEIEKPLLGGGMKMQRVFMRSGEQVRLRGYAVPFGKIPKYTIIGDFALTEVNRDFWEKWKMQNAKLEMLQKGLIFEHGEKASVEAYAQEHAELSCGLEPLNPDGDKRAEKVESPNLTDIEPDSDRPAKRAA